LSENGVDRIVDHIRTDQTATFSCFKQTNALLFKLTLEKYWFSEFFLLSML
jgi:hypothetical protein